MRRDGRRWDENVRNILGFIASIHVLLFVFKLNVDCQ